MCDRPADGHHMGTTRTPSHIEEDMEETEILRPHGRQYNGGEENHLGRRHGHKDGSNDYVARQGYGKSGMTSARQIHDADDDEVTPSRMSSGAGKNTRVSATEVDDYV